MGTKNLDLKTHLKNSKSKNLNTFLKAYDVYPNDWIKRSIDKGNLSLKSVKRGYYDDKKGIIALSGNGNEQIFATAIHELGHRYYQVVIEKIAENKGISYNRAKELIEEPINKYILNISKIGYESIDMYISSYAYTKYIHNNREELFAETFTLWNNIDENNLLANYIKKVLNDNEISKS